MEEKSAEAVVFLDASVLVAAVLSPTGGSFRVIIESAVRGFLHYYFPVCLSGNRAHACN